MITISYVAYTFLVLLMVVTSSTKATANVPRELFMGYTVTPNPSVTNFQPLLSDSSGNFSLGFLRVNQNRLELAIVHVPSGESLWQASSNELASWGKHTQLSFNGSLVLADPKSDVFWSTNTSGDQVVLTTGANLQVLKKNEITLSASNSRFVLWESFDFPTDTLMENQNFTSNMSLISSNGLYRMGLGFNFIGLYAKFKSSNSIGPGQIYFKHGALQAKTHILPGHGPITVRVSSDGFMGIYQNGSVPADIQSFTSYYRTVPGPRRVRLEPDGNLKGYFWSGSSWVIDYVAIPEPCELPSPCGPYGLCKPGEGCLCLDNQTQAQPGECHPGFGPGLDLCGVKGNKYFELRRKGVELPYKELMDFTKTASYEDCEKSCVMNCTCWGVLYSNTSGFCYNVDYPIETILGVSDESKMGYFKVWKNVEKKRDKWLWIGIGLLCVGIVVLVGVLCLASYKLCNRNRGVKNMFLEEEDIVSPGSYKDLGSCSFGSVELISNK